MSTPSQQSQSPSPPADDPLDPLEPNIILDVFENWMLQEGLTWGTLSLLMVDRYRDYLIHREKMLAYDVERRLDVILNAFGQIVNTEMRPSVADDALFWSTELAYDLDIVLSGQNIAPTKFPRIGEIPFREAFFEYFMDYRGELVRAITKASPDARPTLKKAVTIVDSLLERLETDGRIRLSPLQVAKLLAKPDIESLQGMRDLVVLTLPSCMGLRETEVQAIEVSDLRHDLHSMLALHIPPGKGCTERLVPYGRMIWVLHLLETWLRRAQIEEGPVVRGFYRDGTSVRPNRIGMSAIRRIVENYPVEIEPGHKLILTPLDLRRTYARRMYAAGMDRGALQANLGVAEMSTVMEYVGKTRTLERFAPSVYPVDANLLRLLEQDSEK